MENKRKRILIIEDDDDFVHLVKDVLEEYCIFCDAAGDAHEGIEKAECSHPDLILLDLMLPKMSGFGFMREYQGHPALKGIPIVVLTALEDEEILNESMDLGAVGCLSKAAIGRDLVAKISAYL